MTYSEKLKDPRWQKKRLEVLQRDDFTCQSCLDTESTLHVHHHWYEKGKNPWEYPDNCFITLCESCHENETDQRKGMEEQLLQTLREAGLSYNDVEQLGGLLHDYFVGYKGRIFPPAFDRLENTITECLNV